MAELRVTIEQLHVRKHPNADALELANVGSKDGYQVVIRKGDFQNGDRVLYIPEGAEVPADILEELGLTGRLTGPGKNVVKAIRLRGELSQGLVWRPKSWAPENFGTEHNHDADWAEFFGITKFVPEVPVHMSGKQIPAPDLMGWIEIENLKKYPKTFTEGELVQVSEKVHGTCSIFQLDVATGELTVSSKGVAASGLSLARQTKVHTTPFSAADLKHIKRAALYAKFFLRSWADKRLAQVKPQVTTKTEGNLYWRVADAYSIASVLRKVANDFDGCTKVAVYGEVYGAGIQDLTYGASGRSEKPGFAAFDLRVGWATGDQWLSINGLQGELPRVPTLYEGPYQRAEMEKLASGVETISGDYLHLREGIVVRPLVERDSAVLKGRAIGKLVSEAYLTRKQGDKGVETEPTEFN